VHHLCAEFEIECWALSVGRFPSVPKKIPPPTSEGREGRLFPPEQSSKTVELLNELLVPRNKILQEVMKLAYSLSKLSCETGYSLPDNLQLRPGGAVFTA
jgi:hypothetical protein